MKKFTFGVGVVFIIYALALDIIYGNIVFSNVFLGIGILGVIYYFTIDKLMKFQLFKKLYRWFKWVFVACFSIFVLVEGIIVFYPKHEVIENPDYVMILGAGIKGEQISLTLQGRLDTAIEYINENSYKGKILLSGGQGPEEAISEATAMKRYLVQNGISEDRLILEEKSTSTLENFKFSKEYFEKDSGKSISDLNIQVITCDFHALRSNMIAKRMGYGHTKVYTNTTLVHLMPTSFTREFFALGKSIVFDR